MQNLPLSNCDDLISFLRNKTYFDNFVTYDLEMIKANPNILGLIKQFYDGMPNLLTDPYLLDRLEFLYQNPKILIMSRNVLTSKKMNAIFFDETDFGIIFPYKHKSSFLQPHSDSNFDFISLSLLKNFFHSNNLLVIEGYYKQFLYKGSIKNIILFSIPLNYFPMDKASDRVSSNQDINNLEIVLFASDDNFVIQIFYNSDLLKETLIDIEVDSSLKISHFFEILYDFLFPFTIDNNFFQNLNIEKTSSLKEYMEVMETYRDTYKMYKI